MPTDDLASLFRTQPSAGMRYGQGRIISWDPDTFENVIEWNGTPLENLPVVGTTDALSYQPGQYVALHGTDASGAQGMTQWWIAGRILIPGTENAAEVVAFLQGSLAREISAEIFAERMHSASDPDQIERASSSFGAPDSPGVAGPIVADVTVETGSAIVIVSALLKYSTEDTASSDVASAGFVGFRISGATSRAPTDERSATAFSQKHSAGLDGAGMANWATCTAVNIETGLNPGVHTFTMEYAKNAVASEDMTCMLRNLLVITF